MDVFEAIRTTRAMRRLDQEREVSEDALLTILDAAGRAPTGGNSQPVRWLVVRDPACRSALGEIYSRAWHESRRHYVPEGATADDNPIIRSADYLAENMGRAPVIIVPCARGAHPASVYPALQNLFLAARALGLGTTLTTVHTRHEDEVRSVLGIPSDVKTYAMIPLGYPTGRWGEATRRPVHEVTYWDGWGRKIEPATDPAG